MKIKLCGIRTIDDVRLINEAKPDFCGFIVEFPQSFRSVSESELRKLTAQVSPEIKKVGVFVNAQKNLVIRLLQEHVIDLAQLHGQEDNNYIEEIQSRTGKMVIKAFSIKTKEDVERALQSPADYILLDQGNGGTGQTFDWSLVPKINRPWFLAGGLGADNLQTAITRLHPWGIDLSSSLETNRKKDPAKIKQIMELKLSEYTTHHSDAIGDLPAEGSASVPSGKYICASYSRNTTA